MIVYERERELQTVWPDGYIIFQSLAIYTNENLPNNIKIDKVAPPNCAKD